ncbi:dispanin subfamily A member 2b-like [Rhynochetos jubatus]
MERARALGPVLPPYEPLAEGLDVVGVEVGGLPPSAVVSVEPPPPPGPRDHLAWSLCTALYANFCCLGFLALVFSVKARDRKLLGDYSGALSYGSTAKYLNVAALVLQIFLVALFIALLATGTIVVANFFHYQGQQPFGGPT